MSDNTWKALVDKYQQMLGSTTTDSTAITNVPLQPQDNTTIGTDTTGTLGQLSWPLQYKFVYSTTGSTDPKLHHDRDGSWVEIDPDEPNQVAGIILWKDGKAVKLTVEQLLRHAGLVW